LASLVLSQVPAGGDFQRLLREAEVAAAMATKAATLSSAFGGGGMGHGALRGDHHAMDAVFVERDTGKRERRKRRALGATSVNCSITGAVDSCSRQARTFFFTDTPNCDGCGDRCQRKVCIDFGCSTKTVSHVGVAGSCTTTPGAACVKRSNYGLNDAALCQVVNSSQVARFIIKDASQCIVDSYSDPAGWTCQRNLNATPGTPLVRCF
jgi:hypothetical protein